MANENNFKEKADYAAYKKATENPVPKFKFRSAIVNEFKDELMPEVEALLS
jgi:type I restriction enzyme R subunit